ncbi:MAG: hypothetical protein ABIJ09_21185 [Pseudomonadota bacterium]
MGHAAASWARQGALIAALALGTLCCEGGRYQLILSYPDQAALDRARWVDLFVGEALSCEALRQANLAPRLSFDARGAMPSLGEVGFGRVAFRAEVRDDGCLVFVDGCVEQTLQAGQDAILRISLQATSGAGCAAAQRCEGGRCLVADGGGGDAVSLDLHASDNGSVDQAPLDGGGDDVATADATAMDSAHADASASGDTTPGSDAASSDDSGGAADSAPAVDGAGGDDASGSPDASSGLDSGGASDAAGNPDAAIADAALPDTRVCVPAEVSCRGDILVTCDSAGSVEDALPCPLGCNGFEDPARCNLLDPSNMSRTLIGGWDFDVLLDTDVVVDTTAITINGTPLDSSEYSIVSQGAGAPQLLVFGARNMVVASGVRVRIVGSRAVALVATETVQLAGIIDISATGTAEHIGDTWPWFYTETGGPGGFSGGDEGVAGDGPCPGQPGVGVDVANIYSKGSGGGGHGGAGGEGGPSQDGSGTWLGGGEGGGVCGSAELVPLVGGSGGAGQSIVVGEGPAGDWLGPGGGGGGALQISAGESITIAAGGGIQAAGGGGGQTGNAGGAGGGAGGAVLIEAPLVFVEQNAFVTAAGGGGASGDCT